MKNRSLFPVILLIAVQSAFAQSWSPSENPDANFHTLRQHFYDYWAGKTPQPGEGYSVFKRWEWFWQSRVLPDGSFPASDIKEAEWNHYLASQPATESVSAANWTSMGPNSSAVGIGRINCIAVDPNNSNTIWVGAPTGGLWKTTNGGATWTTNTDNFTVLSVTAVAIDPSNTNTMYIGTGDGFGNYEPSIGILKSTDGGNTWNATGLSWSLTSYRYIRHIIVHPNGTVLAAASDGLYRSTNGGANWVKEITDNFFDVKFKPGAPDVIYAASDNRLYTSTNIGADWTSALTIANSGRVVIAVTPANPAMVAAASSSNETDTYGAFNGLYVSTDSGNSYTLKSSSPNLLSSGSDGSATKGQGWYDFCIAVSPADANLIFVGGVNLWKSTNGGTTWSLATYWNNSGPPGVPVIHADKHALLWLGNTLYSGNDGGIHKTTNNGASWTFISGNLVISQMYRLGVSQSDNKVICGLQDNGTKLRSTTGTWTDNIGGDGMECFIHPANSNIMYGESQYGHIRRSTNGGGSWTNIHVNVPGEPDGAWVTPFVMDPNNSTTLYVGYDEVYKSTNQGNSWTAISSLNPVFDMQHIAVAPSSGNTIYACDGDQVFLTTNGGTSWNNVTGNLPTANTITYLAVDPGNANTVYVTFGGYTAGQKVYRTTTGGGTWTNISGTLPNIPANCITVQPNSGGVLYMGMDVGIFRRAAGATDWTLFNTGLPNVIVSELEIRHSTGKIRAATYGRGLWESDMEPVNSCGTPASLSVTDLEPRSATLNWNAVNTAVNYNVDVRVAGQPNWFTFTGITGTSLGLVYFTPCTDYEFRVQAVCAGNAGDYSNTHTISIPGCSDYCTSFGIDTLLDPPLYLPDEWIENVSIGNINNTSGNDWGYNDYTNLSTDLNQDSAYTITLTPGFSTSAYGETWAVWIDWNRDNDFDDAGELVFTHPASTTVVTGSFVAPSTAVTGNTRMRVSMKWDALADPCGQHIYAEIEDYSVNIVKNIVCDAPAGLFVTDIAERTATLHWSAVTDASSYIIEFREQGSPFWVESGDIFTNDRPLIYLTPCTSYEFRVKSKCDGVFSPYSDFANFSTTGCSNYCPSYGEDSTPLPLPDEWIENVLVGDINNTSGNNWGYADYTGISTTFLQGNVYPITLTPGFSDLSYTETWSVWVDWNQDNVFSDANELAFSHPGSSAVVAGTLVVPFSAMPGNTTMRVKMKYSDIPGNPCEAPFQYGEVEDYTVTIGATAAFLQLNPASLTFPAPGNNQTLTLTTNCDWSVTGIPAWLTVNPSSGGAGTFSLTITANNNASIDPRIATLTFTGCNGQVIQNLLVAQDGAAADLTLNPATLTFPFGGNTQTLTLTTNCDWSATDIPAWLTVNPSSGSAGTVTVSVTAENNLTFVQRFATLTFTGCNGQVAQSLSIVQNGVISIHPDTLYFPAGGNSQTVILTSACTTWDLIFIPSWLTLDPSSGTAGGTITVTADANDSTAPRTFTLIFSCDDQIFENLVIVQGGATPYLDAPALIEVPHTEGTATINVLSNTDWMAEENVPWLEMPAPVSGSGDAQVSVTYLANPDTMPRSGDVVFTFNGFQKTVTILQNGMAVGAYEAGNNSRNKVVCLPNPASEAARFLVQTDRYQMVHLEIIAPDGRIVTSLKNIAVGAGASTIPWRPSDLPAGHYWFRCFFENEVVIGKIAVTR